jgi:hypothetical protein
MKKKTVARLIALLTATSLCATGCGSIVSEDVASYPLESPLTRQEVIDYYAKALEYDAVITKNVTVHETTYVTQEIEGEKAERLKSLTEQCEALLGLDSYELTVENQKLLSEDTFNYIKATLDNDVLSNGKIQDITGALGYYFVDVTYDVSPKTVGEFNSLTTYAGIDGIFYSNADGTYSIDAAYLAYIPDVLNEYYYNNNIIKNAVYHDDTGVFEIQDGVVPDYKYSQLTQSNLDSSSSSYFTNESYGNGTGSDYDWYSDDTSSSSEDDSVNSGGDDVVLNLPGDSTEDTEVSTLEGTEAETEQSETQTEGSNEDTEATGIDSDTTETTVVTDAQASLTTENTYASVVDADRQIQFDVSLINSVAGSSTRQRATIPDLSLVYNIPEAEGEISGYGIANGGGDGLRVFGLDRTQLQGTATLRYVFKDDVNGTGDILGKNIYITEENITNGATLSDSTVLLPEFLQTELEKVVERYDRCMANCDIAGIMGGNLCLDMGIGVLRSYKEQSTGTQKYMSTIRQVLGRDTANNAYLLELETTTIDGARDVDCYGTYKDKGYMVIQQQGNQFVIVDYLRISRTMTSEPPINPDSTIAKRLVALNLAGEIPDDSKSDITDLMSALYTAGTNRLLRGPKEITVRGESVTIEKGLYDCFQDDTDILDTSTLEYTLSKLENALIKHGTDVTSVYSGTITEWIGGYDNQAEFTTEELITYNGREDAYYMQVYYLVSKLNDKWVIDERTILDEEEVTDATTIDNIKSRVGQ